MTTSPGPPIPRDRPLAIFCDFDGTFSVQDVGSTLAQQRLPEKRARLWERFADGEVWVAGAGDDAVPRSAGR